MVKSCGPTLYISSFQHVTSICLPVFRHGRSAVGPAEEFLFEVDGEAVGHPQEGVDQHGAARPVQVGGLDKKYS